MCLPLITSLGPIFSFVLEKGRRTKGLSANVVTAKPNIYEPEGEILTAVHKDMHVVLVNCDNKYFSKYLFKRIYFRIYMQIRNTKVYIWLDGPLIIISEYHDFCILFSLELEISNNFCSAISKFSYSYPHLNIIVCITANLHSIFLSCN